MAYTWSHTLDNSNSALSNGAGGIVVGANGTPLLKYSYGNSNSDQRQLFVASAIYELPIGKGKPYLNNIPTAVNYVIGGWQWNNVLTLSSGTPIDISGSTGLNGRPTYHGGCTEDASFQVWLQCPASAFTATPAGTVSNLARNYFHGPGTHTLDTTLSKTVSITERVKTEFRAQVYNLLNTPQFQNPDTNYTDPVNLTAGTGFGVLNTPRTLTNRELELALRVSF
jgi:hypothetical protein